MTAALPARGTEQLAAGSPSAGAGVIACVVCTRSPTLLPLAGIGGSRAPSRGDGHLRLNLLPHLTPSRTHWIYTPVGPNQPFLGESVNFAGKRGASSLRACALRAAGAPACGKACLHRRAFSHRAAPEGLVPVTAALEQPPSLPPEARGLGLLFLDS